MLFHRLYSTDGVCCGLAQGLGYLLHYVFPIFGIIGHIFTILFLFLSKYYHLVTKLFTTSVLARLYESTGRAIALALVAVSALLRC